MRCSLVSDIEREGKILEFILQTLISFIIQYKSIEDLHDSADGVAVCFFSSFYSYTASVLTPIKEKAFFNTLTGLGSGTIPPSLI